MMFGASNIKDLQQLKWDLEKEEGISSCFTQKKSLIAYTSINGKGFIKIPPCVRNIQFVEKTNFIPLEENGGTNNLGCGCGQIICGVKGEKLKPFFIKKSTARFLVKQAVMITAENNGTDVYDVKIECFKIEERENNVYGYRSLIFKGQCKKNWFNDDFPEMANQNELLEIPYYILFFYFAAREAIRKSRCRECKRPHYVDVQKNSTPDMRPYLQETQPTLTCPWLC